jgi:hypothetical protein
MIWFIQKKIMVNVGNGICGLVDCINKKTKGQIKLKFIDLWCWYFFNVPISKKTLMFDWIDVCLRCACIPFVYIMLSLLRACLSHQPWKWCFQEFEPKNHLTMKVMFLGFWVGQDVHTVFR